MTSYVKQFTFLFDVHIDSGSIPMIPMGCAWNHFYQLDPGAYNCSAKEARLRWPAEAIFGRVLNTPSLKGTISN